MQGKRKCLLNPQYLNMKLFNYTEWYIKINFFPPVFCSILQNKTLSPFRWPSNELGNYIESDWGHFFTEKQLREHYDTKKETKQVFHTTHPSSDRTQRRVQLDKSRLSVSLSLPMPEIKADAILYSVLKIKQKYSATFQQFPIDNAFTDWISGLYPLQ